MILPPAEAIDDSSSHKADYRWENYRRDSDKLRLFTFLNLQAQTLNDDEVRSTTFKRLGKGQSITH